MAEGRRKRVARLVMTKTQMKKLMLISLAVVGFALASQAQLAPKTVTLGWQPIPPAQVSPDLKIRIYSNDNLAVPMALWVMLIEVSATNNTATFTIQPGEHFFVATAYSSFWKEESSFSNVASTPPLPSGLFNLTIRLGL